MGMLTSWLTAVGKQNPSSRNLLDALTGEEDDLTQLKKILAQAKLSKLLTEARLGEKPIWEEGQLPPSASLPGGPRAVGDIIAPGTYKAGPTYGEAGAMADIIGKLPLSPCIRAR